MTEVDVNGGSDYSKFGRGRVSVFTMKSSLRVLSAVKTAFTRNKSSLLLLRYYRQSFPLNDDS